MAEGEEFSAGFTAGQAGNIARQQAAQKQRIEGLNFLTKFRPMLEEAAQIEDPARRKTTINDLMAGYQANFGQAVDKNTVAWITQNPEQFVGVLKHTSEEGLRIDQIFPMLGNPMLRGAVMLALERGATERTAQGALSGRVTPGASTANEQPEQLSGPGADQPQSGAASESQSPVVAPTPALEQRAMQLEQEIAALDRRAELVSKSKNHEGLKVIEAIRARKALELSQLREQPALAAAADDRKPVDPAQLREVAQTNPELRPQLRVGMTQGELNGLLKKPATEQPASGAATTPAAPVAGASAPGTPAATGGVRTPAEMEVEKAEIARRSTKLSADELRDPAVAKAGISTQGQLEDAIKAGTVKLEDIASQTRRKELATKLAESSVKDFETVKQYGQLARESDPLYDILAAAALRVGPTGPWVTPIRETLNNAAQLLGVANPGKMRELDLISSITPRLAINLTQHMKGSQSDREFLAGVQSAVSKYNSPAGLATLLYVKKELNAVDKMTDIAARKWVGQNGALDNTNAAGLTFQEAFDKSIDAYNKQNGALSERVAAALKLDHKQLLKNIVKPIKAAE